MLIIEGPRADREVKRRRRGRDWVEEFEPRRLETHNRFDSLLRDEDGRRNRRERINEGEQDGERE